MGSVQTLCLVTNWWLCTPTIHYRFMSLEDTIPVDAWVSFETLHRISEEGRHANCQDQADSQGFWQTSKRGGSSWWEIPLQGHHSLHADEFHCQDSTSKLAQAICCSHHGQTIWHLRSTPMTHAQSFMHSYLSCFISLRLGPGCWDQGSSRCNTHQISHQNKWNNQYIMITMISIFRHHVPA